MRSADFGVGQTQKFRVLVDDTIYDLLLAGLNYEEVYLAKFGDIECLKVEPQAKFGSIFVRKGKIYMWFSDDERLVCTKVEAVLPVANLKAILRAVKGPGKDFWTSGKRRKGKKGKQSGGRKEQEPGSSRTAVTSNALSDTLLRTGKTAQD
jgi:hypothetical protein